MHQSYNDKVRKKLEKDIKEYLARGGTIKKIPAGEQKKVIKVDFVSQKRQETGV